MENNIAYKDPTQLHSHPYNQSIYGCDPTQEKEDFERLKSTIEVTGEIKPLTINPKGEIIKGNRRREVAIALKHATVPCIIREYESTEAELLDLLADNTARHTSIEQRIREALAWQKAAETVENLSPPKGMKTRDWLGKRAGMSGVSFADGQKAVEAIDYNLAIGNAEEASLLRQELNKSVNAAKQLMKALQGTGASRSYVYSGEGAIAFDKSELRKGDAVVLNPHYKPSNPEKIGVTRQFAETPMTYEVYWDEIQLTIQVSGKKEYWRDRASHKITVPQSPTETRFLQRCDELHLNEQIELSQQRHEIIDSQIFRLRDYETDGSEGAIALLEREIETEKELRKELKAKRDKQSKPKPQPQPRPQPAPKPPTKTPDAQQQAEEASKALDTNWEEWGVGDRVRREDNGMEGEVVGFCGRPKLIKIEFDGQNAVTSLPPEHLITMRIHRIEAKPQQTMEGAIASCGFKEGDWVQDLTEDRVGQVFHVKAHEIGLSRDRSFLVELEVKWSGKAYTQPSRPEFVELTNAPGEDYSDTPEGYDGVAEEDEPVSEELELIDCQSPSQISEYLDSLTHEETVKQVWAMVQQLNKF